MTTNYSDLGFIKVAACSPEVSIGNPISNAQQIAKSVKKQTDQGVTVSVFPELSITGYSAEDLFFSETLIQETLTGLKLLAEESRLPLLVVGAPWRLRDGRLLNCAVVISDQRVLGMVPKSAHPNHGEFYDLRWFSDGSQVNEAITDDTLGSFQVRVDQLFETETCTLGIELCEDLWAPINPSTAACLAGANLIANPSASTELITKAQYRRSLVELTSAKNLCGYIYSGAGPTESSKDVVFGGHCLISECGQNLGEIQDIEYFQKKLYRSLNIPISRLEGGQGFNLGRAAEISRDEVKFTKFVGRLRKKFTMLFHDLLKTQLILKGVIAPEEWDSMMGDITYTFLQDGYFAELKHSEMMRERVQLAQQLEGYVGKYFSNDYIRTKILKQNEQEQEEIDKQIEEEGAESQPEENPITPREKEDDGKEEKPTLGDK